MSSFYARRFQMRKNDSQVVNLFHTYIYKVHIILYKVVRYFVFQIQNKRLGKIENN